MASDVIVQNCENLFGLKVTIPNGAAQSEIFSVQGFAIVGLIIPSAWTAANIGLKVSMSGNPTELQDLINAGGVYVQTQVTAATPIAIPFGDTAYFPFMALTSVAAGTTTPVNQGAARDIIILRRQYLT